MSAGSCGYTLHMRSHERKRPRLDRIASSIPSSSLSPFLGEVGLGWVGNLGSREAIECPRNHSLLCLAYVVSCCRDAPILKVQPEEVYDSRRIDLSRHFPRHSTTMRRPSKIRANERGHSLRQIITRISPLGCMIPTPILSSKKVGRSVDLGSASIVYFINKRTIRAFTSF